MPILLVLAVLVQSAKSPTYVPSGGYVPDAPTAVAIARAVLIPVYGRATVAGEEPLVAHWSGEVWTVQGTFNHPRTSVGGTALVLISRRTGTILRMIHTK